MSNDIRGVLRELVINIESSQYKYANEVLLVPVGKETPTEKLINKALKQIEELVINSINGIFPQSDGDSFSASRYEILESAVLRNLQNLFRKDE
jgi:hypothetical protein